MFTEVEGKVRQRGEKKMKENRIIAFVLLYDKLDSFFFKCSVKFDIVGFRVLLAFIFKVFFEYHILLNLGRERGVLLLPCLATVGWSATRLVMGLV